MQDYIIDNITRLGPNDIGVRGSTLSPEALKTYALHPTINRRTRENPETRNPARFCTPSADSKTSLVGQELPGS